MLFNSIDYLLFFPIVILLYFLIPNKARNFWLLLASYFFYMCWNAEYAILILFSTVVTYLCAILLGCVKQKKWKKMILGSSLLLNLVALCYFKYTNFILHNLSRILGIFHFELKTPEVDILLPVGISFFTFQALGYTIDVYRNEIKAEKNIIRYALFVSFFPQLVAGPIERSKNLLRQFGTPNSFNVDRARSGLLTMAYGLFLKIVVADNIAVIIDPVFLEINNYVGVQLLLAVMLFAFQIYCDFDGYTKIAIGSAEILGYRLNANFNTPYMAVSVKDFWKRWHISLTSWFRDYLYIPLGGNRKGTIRKEINNMLVFLLSGLWHGAAWHYVIWGGLNGAFCVFEDLINPVKSKLFRKFKINERKISYKICQRLYTFVLVDFTWLFFRADSFGKGMLILKRIVTNFKGELFLTAGYYGLFSSTRELMTLVLSLGILFIIDALKYMGKDVKKIIFSQQIVFRWIIYWMIFMIILYWGIYGTGYEQKQFIYFQF